MKMEKIKKALQNLQEQYFESPISVTLVVQKDEAIILNVEKLQPQPEQPPQPENNDLN